MDKAFLLQLVSQIFEVCIIPLLGVLTAYAISFIRIKTKELSKATEKLENEMHQQMLQKYLNMAEKTVEECVIATNQTFVDSLKKKGEFNKDAWNEAFQKTYEAVLGILAEEGQMYLTEAVGDVNLYLTNLIESAVSKNKSEKGGE